MPDHSAPHTASACVWCFRVRPIKLIYGSAPEDCGSYQRPAADSYVRLNVAGNSHTPGGICHLLDERTPQSEPSARPAQTALTFCPTLLSSPPPPSSFTSPTPRQRGCSNVHNNYICPTYATHVLGVTAQSLPSAVLLSVQIVTSAIGQRKPASLARGGTALTKALVGPSASETVSTPPANDPGVGRR